MERLEPSTARLVTLHCREAPTTDHRLTTGKPPSSMFRLLLRIGILAAMVLALAIPKADARPTPSSAAALAAPHRALLSARPPAKERRSLVEVATQGLFDIFGLEVGGRWRSAASLRGGSASRRTSSSSTFARVTSFRGDPPRRCDRPRSRRKKKPKRLVTDRQSRPPPLPVSFEQPPRRTTRCVSSSTRCSTRRTS